MQLSSSVSRYFPRFFGNFCLWVEKEQNSAWLSNEMISSFHKSQMSRVNEISFCIKVLKSFMKWMYLIGRRREAQIWLFASQCTCPACVIIVKCKLHVPQWVSGQGGIADFNFFSAKASRISRPHTICQICNAWKNWFIRKYTLKTFICVLILSLVLSRKF